MVVDLQFKQAASFPIREAAGGRGQGELGFSPGRAGEAVPALVNPGSRYVFVSDGWSPFSIPDGAII